MKSYFGVVKAHVEEGKFVLTIKNEKFSFSEFEC